jgi:hypothetical protein
LTKENNMHIKSLLSLLLIIICSQATRVSQLLTHQFALLRKGSSHKSLVIPSLGYAYFALDHYSKGAIDQLEMVQR